MTEREMGMILATLDQHKEQLDRIEQTIAENSRDASQQREQANRRLGSLEQWQARSFGAIGLAVFVIPVAVSVVIK